MSYGWDLPYRLEPPMLFDDDDRLDETMIVGADVGADVTAVTLALMLPPTLTLPLILMSTTMLMMAMMTMRMMSMTTLPVMLATNDDDVTSDVSYQ